MATKYLFILSMLWAFSTNALAQADSVTISLTYPHNEAKAVFLAGSFNNWTPETHPFKKVEQGWEIDFRLPDGYYYYKIVADGNWQPDPTHDWKINDGGSGFNSILKVGEPPVPKRMKREVALNKELLPKPILTDHPQWANLYYVAWEMAWDKIGFGTPQNGFVESYMDEGFNELIYQWDLCFITSFGIYGRNLFPAMPSLDNFYLKQREDGYIQRVYWETNGQPAHEPTKEEPMTNPPLFAWVEWRYYQISGDDSRLKRVLPVLVKYFNWIEQNCKSNDGTGLYYTTELGSGMDNTPRHGVGQAAWVDFSTQQALAAFYISKIATVVKDKDTEVSFSNKHKELSTLINQYCWNQETGFYHDLKEKGGHSPTKHIGAFWPLLAQVADNEKSAALLEHLQNREEFWRAHLVPSLSADDPEFDFMGHYWKGGVWAPTNYMVVKGLEKIGQYDLAQQIAMNHVHNMMYIHQARWPNSNKIAFEERYEDGYQTIWECYAPDRILPATRWDNTFYSRQDFVGWSGLGPIAMLIENILGFEINGAENTVTWRINRTDLHGIENIQLKDQQVTLLCQPEEHKLTLKTECTKPFKLKVMWNEKTYDLKVKSGKREIVIK
jgi:hypothetical protein